MNVWGPAEQFLTDDSHGYVDTKEQACSSFAPRRMLRRGSWRFARSRSMEMTITKEIQNCIDACGSCASVCRECAKMCDQMGGMEKCSQLCLECASICEQHSLHLARGDHSKNASCIAACKACATECEKGADHMESCKRCAEACRMCAEACEHATDTNA